ncbi:MAG: glutaredoxin domain-containing protein [Verrucomicrobiota bacterium]|nr:glutaredoxin domain-containing protein [Verrucomicrobiota bacterium]
MSDPNIDLYIKPDCPWCVAVIAWLDKKGYKYHEYDVIDDDKRFEEMVRITGQNFAPSLRLHMEGMVDKILYDFGTEELETFLDTCDLRPD